MAHAWAPLLCLILCALQHFVVPCPLTPRPVCPCHPPAHAQVGESWNALAHIRQAVTFLVIHQKHRKSFREITEDLCGSLSVQQLYRISTMYWDDRWAAGGGVGGALLVGVGLLVGAGLLLET